MNRQMYITGGVLSNQQSSQTFSNLISVNLTKPFTVADFTLQDSANVAISSLGTQAPVANYGALFGNGVNGTQLWSFGGEANSQAADIRYFDLGKGYWNLDPLKKGTSASNTSAYPTSRSAFAWSLYNGKFYSCGGNVTSTGKLSAEFWQFDIAGGSWKSMPTLSSAPAVQYHQATIVLNQYFIVMGGQTSDGKIRDLSQVWVFDLKSSRWKSVSTSGGEGIPMVKFTPVARNDSIIIQGGASDIDPDSPGYKIYPDLFILNITTWEWTRVPLLDEAGNPTNSGRASYSAWIIGNQLVQFLGEYNSSLSTPSQAQVIDLDRFIIAKAYQPPDLSWFNRAYSDSDGDRYNKNYHATGMPASMRNGIIIGVVLGCAGLLGLAGVLFYFYRRRVQKLEKEFAPAEPFLEPINIQHPVVWAGQDEALRPPSSADPKALDMTNSTRPTTTTLSAVSSNPPPSFSTHQRLTNNDPTGNHHQHNLSASDDTDVDPLFALRTDTILPGESYQEAVNSRFES